MTRSQIGLYSNATASFQPRKPMAARAHRGGDLLLAACTSTDRELRHNVQAHPSRIQQRPGNDPCTRHQLNGLLLNLDNKAPSNACDVLGNGKNASLSAEGKCVCQIWQCEVSGCSSDRPFTSDRTSSDSSRTHPKL